MDPSSENQPNANSAEQVGAEQVQPTTPPQQQQEAQQVNDQSQVAQAAQPVTYTDFGAPEGVNLDQGALGSFKDIASEANLSQEQAQKMVDIGVQMQQKWAADQAQAMEAAHSQWAESSKQDPEFGGQNFEENIGIAKSALDRFGSPELQQLLNDSGFGNHPEVIRFLYKTGKAISNDKFVGGGQGAAQPKSAASIMYPNHPQE